MHRLKTGGANVELISPCVTWDGAERGGTVCATSVAHARDSNERAADSLRRPRANAHLNGHRKRTWQRDARWVSAAREHAQHNEKLRNGSAHVSVCENGYDGSETKTARCLGGPFYGKLLETQLGLLARVKIVPVHDRVEAHGVRALRLPPPVRTECEHHDVACTNLLIDQPGAP